MAEETKQHINFIEMLAVLFALKSFHTLIHGKDVKIMADNTTTESTITSTSHSPKLNKLRKDIWDWYSEQHVILLLTMVCIPGCKNVEATKELHTFRRSNEQCLRKPFSQMLAPLLRTSIVSALTFKFKGHSTSFHICSCSVQGSFIYFYGQ